MEKEICWNITAKCNQACKYCHRFLNINDLSYEDNLKILYNLYHSGVTCITWTGGEALLLNDLDNLLQKSFNLGIKNKLITNGKLLTIERIEKIHSYLDSITLSIDSIDDGINEMLGRGKDHFKEIKSILDYMQSKKYEVKIRINTVICKQNFKSIVLLTDFLNHYSIYGWRIFKFMPLRETAIKNKNYFKISNEDYFKTLDIIKSNSNIPIIDSRIQEDMEKKYILILANGDIVITENGRDIKVGNALNDSMKLYIET